MPDSQFESAPLKLHDCRDESVAVEGSLFTAVRNCEVGRTDEQHRKTSRGRRRSLLAGGCGLELRTLISASRSLASREVAYPADQTLLTIANHRARWHVS